MLGGSVFGGSVVVVGFGVGDVGSGNAGVEGGGGHCRVGELYGG